MATQTSNTPSIEALLRSANERAEGYFVVSLDLKLQLDTANARNETLERRMEWAKGMMRSSMDQRQMLMEHNADLMKQVREMGDGMRDFAERHWSLTEDLERKYEDQKTVIRELVSQARNLSHRLEAALKLIDEGVRKDDGNNAARKGGEPDRMRHRH